jgi:xylono-1,5-lactonase
LGEGVFWHEAEQAVYWLDIIQSNLHRLAADGRTDYWHFPGQISAVVPCDDGGLLATFENGLSHLDLDTATVTPLLALETELQDNRFNDGSSDTRGQFWFGSMDNNQQEPSGSFYRMDRSGDVERVDSFGQICITNGPTFSTDGRWVYFTDSIERKIYRAPLQEDGRPGSPELYLKFEERDGFPDGMCTDTDGGLWVCHFAGGRVTRFLADGKADQVIEMPVPNITKCAFGGPELRTLYIITAATALNEKQREEYPLSGGLFAIELPYSGTAMRPVARANTNV